MSVYLVAKEREVAVLRNRLETKSREIDRLRGLLRGWLDDYESEDGMYSLKHYAKQFRDELDGSTAAQPTAADADALGEIRARDRESGALWFTGPLSFTAQAARDRRALLGIIDAAPPDAQPKAAPRCPCNCALPDPGKACAGCGRVNDGAADNGNEGQL